VREQVKGANAFLECGWQRGEWRAYELVVAESGGGLNVAGAKNQLFEFPDLRELQGFESALDLRLWHAFGTGTKTAFMLACASIVQNDTRIIPEPEGASSCSPTHHPNRPVCDRRSINTASPASKRR
jgi:hypothetical protein